VCHGIKRESPDELKRESPDEIRRKARIYKGLKLTVTIFHIET
jgi:hypothetical protein